MADYIVTGPDGKKVRVTADNEETLKAAIDHMAGGPQATPVAASADGGSPASQAMPHGAVPVDPATVAPPAPPAEPTLVDRIMGAGKTAAGLGTQGLIGLRKGVSTLAGLPVDLASLPVNAAIWAVNKATGAEIPYATKPIGGGESVDKVLAAPARIAQSATGQPTQDTPPDGLAERLVRRVGEEVGTMAVPAAAALKTASRVGVEGAREMNPIARMMVEPAAVNPGKFVQKETTAAAAAGGGAGTVNEMTGKAQVEAKGGHATPMQNLGDVGGAVTGVGTAALVKKLKDVGGHVLGALTGRTGIANEVVRDVTTDEIARMAGLVPDAKTGAIDTGPLARKIEDGTRVADTIPGFQESTADRIKNPGMAAAEYSRQTGPNSGVYSARRTANTDAIDTAMDKNAPTGQPGAFRSELETQRDARIGQATDARVDAEGAATTAVQPLTPTGTPAARGNTIRGELDTARQGARDATSEAYEAAGIHGNPLAPTHLAEALDRTTASLPYADRVGTPQALIDQIANIPPGTPTTVREASALKTQLLGLQETAASQPGGRNTVRVLGQYIDAVEEVIQSSITPQQRQALGEARTARRAEGDAFERKGDPVADILATRPGGQPRMRDENVAGLSVRTDALDRILAQADTPATREAIRNEILSNADTSSAAGIHAFQQQYAEQLRRFPGLDDQIGAAIRARVSENTARGAEGALLKEIGEQGRGPVAKYLAYGNENAEKSMRMVMADKDPARAIDDLLKFVNDDPKAVDGARKVFWDILQKDTRSAGSTTQTMNGKQPFLTARLKTFLEDPAKAAVAERLYRDNPEHLTNIRAISEAMQGVDVRNSAKAPNTSGTAQGVNQSYLPTGETLASRIFAVERGVVSPAFAAINIAGIIARKAVKQAHVAAVEKAIDKALLDPDWAAALLKENNPANRAALRRSAKGWQAHEVSTIVDMLSPDDPDAETKKAVLK